MLNYKKQELYDAAPDKRRMRIMAFWARKSRNWDLA